MIKSNLIFNSQVSAATSASKILHNDIRTIFLRELSLPQRFLSTHPREYSLCLDVCTPSLPTSSNNNQ